MIRPDFLAMFFICVVCSFCNQDFVSLGRHKWRCKQRVYSDGYEDQNATTSRSTNAIPTPSVVISSKTAIKCCCGKICKGSRGLKMHQRSCHVIHDLNNELLEDLEEQIHENKNLENSKIDFSDSACNLNNEEDFPELKKGIKLPKNENEWLTANEYFKSSLQLNGPITTQDLNSNISFPNNLIYDYFSTNFGHTESVPDEKLVDKYKNHTVKELKRALHNLKLNNHDLSEIKYVSRALRNRLKNNNTTNNSMSSNSENFNHDKYLERNFWGYIKNIFDKKSSLLPSFNMEDCFKYLLFPCV